MEKKGFTLVELLAVIVILAVIALISTPMVLNVIEGSKKGALKDSAYGLLEAADIYYAEHVGGNKKTEFTFEDGKQTSIEQVGYKGYVEKGSMYLYSDGKKALCISDGKYAAIKNVDEEEVRMSSGRCSYNEATEEYETVGICSDLESELERLKKENNQKLEEIRNEYEERISNLTNDYEEQKKTIENNYRDQIEELNRRIEELEASKETEIDQIRADYEAQVKTQQEAYEAQINELNRQLNTFKTGGTASASDIVSGKKAFVQGSLITGSMANKSGQTVTTNTVTQSGENAFITVPESGYYDNTSKISVPIETIQNNVEVNGKASACISSFVSRMWNVAADRDTSDMSFGTSSDTTSIKTSTATHNSTSRTASFGILRDMKVYVYWVSNGRGGALDSVTVKHNNTNISNGSIIDVKTNDKINLTFTLYNSGGDFGLSGTMVFIYEV